MQASDTYDFQPVKDGDIPPTGGKVMVYLVNGRSTSGATPVIRKLVKRKGRWHVRDHGLVPVTRICRDFLTTYAT